MTILVAAASKHGATEEIAERIGAVLAEHGVEVDVKKLRDVSGLAGYEAIVLGSGIYLGKWLKEARRFVEVHAAELAQRPTWAVRQRLHHGRSPGRRRPQRHGGRAG
ncbi:MAG TPA: flavodoxin domain-containing protein [Actinomycetota bacterium]|nr:flavodoxin domain-containing protein [Actinomycetota bacterium]